MQIYRFALWNSKLNQPEWQIKLLRTWRHVTLASLKYLWEQSMLTLCGNIRVKWRYYSDYSKEKKGIFFREATLSEETASMEVSTLAFWVIPFGDSDSSKRGNYKLDYFSSNLIIEK